MLPILYTVIPCYNEQEVLPITSKLFLNELLKLINMGKISDLSRILFVDDGSKDSTFKIITDLSISDCHFEGISLSRNQGHQNALIAGLFEAMDKCDITVSVDCDGQDDITAMEKMIDAYSDGCEIVYGVRNKREKDSFFKRTTAEGFYKFLKFMGVDCVYNHADYRLMSSKALKALSQFNEVNLYLRGMVPLVGFKSTAVYYNRHERITGKSHYPLKKMLSLASDGITSLSVKPIRIITALGFVTAFLSFLGIIWAVIAALTGHTVTGWASLACIICFIGGIQMLCLGIIGEYVGKTYMETKHRPRYIISERTAEDDNNDKDV